MNTNFFLKCHNQAYPEALKRFSRFFISPLLNKSSIKKEMQAVHSEHIKNINSHGFRLMELDRKTGDPKSPYYKFGTGTMKTLNHPSI